LSKYQLAQGVIKGRYVVKISSVLHDGGGELKELRYIQFYKGYSVVVS